MKMSKGSKVRPKKISDKEFIENWLKIFGDPREEKIDLIPVQFTTATLEAVARPPENT